MEKISPKFQHSLRAKYQAGTGHCKGNWQRSRRLTHPYHWQSAPCRRCTVFSKQSCDRSNVNLRLGHGTTLITWMHCCRIPLRQAELKNGLGVSSHHAATLTPPHCQVHFDKAACFRCNRDLTEFLFIIRPPCRTSPIDR
jgi:hypothetical protein